MRKFLFVVLVLSMVSCEKPSDSIDNLKTDISMEVYLTDNTGERRSTFKYKEEIVFNVEITNNTDKNLYIPDQQVFLEREYNSTNRIDVFPVYKTDSVLVGYPWSGMTYGISEKILPGNKLIISIPWQDNSKFYYGNKMFIKEIRLTPLPIGGYYTLYTIFTEDGKYTRKAEFVVIQ